MPIRKFVTLEFSKIAKRSFTAILFDTIAVKDTPDLCHTLVVGGGGGKIYKFWGACDEGS